MTKQLISGNNFARNSDIVFVEEVNLNDFQKLNKKNLFVIRKDKDYVIYINSKMLLNENSLIFCKTDYVDLLFKYLKKIENLNNLKLITSQSDKPIDKKLFLKKPECVSIWYSTNVKYKNDKLISIPLGLANEFSEKNLNQSHFKNFSSLKSEEEKKVAVYANFNVNTKYFFRKKLLLFIQENNLFKISKKSINLSEYKSYLENYRFILCPPGNGIDTHRIWEAIYSNSIPIVFKDYYLEYFKYVPVVVIDSIKQLKDFDVNSKPSLFIKDSLFINWWIDLIKSHTIDSEEKVEIEISVNKIMLYLNLKSYKAKISKFLKNFKTVFIKFDRKLLNNNNENL